MTRDRLSVVIATKNQATLLKECLASVAWADEIVVVDDFSADETAEVCAAYPHCHRFLRSDYLNANMNFGFDQASGEWIMRIDSDERVTPELAAEVQRTLEQSPAAVTGFEFWERRVILGRELRHGSGRKHYRPMMWRRGTARYAVRHTHEDLQRSGLWEKSRHGYLHENYSSVGQYLQKMDFWTERDVERASLPARPPTLLMGIRETVRAFYLYYLRLRGYRDGWIGFVDAGMRAFYQFTYWAKLRARWEREQAPLAVH
jgi:glycosyltransferase involved in cell wall biosynthesis